MTLERNGFGEEIRIPKGNVLEALLSDRFGFGYFGGEITKNLQGFEVFPALKQFYSTALDRISTDPSLPVTKAVNMHYWHSNNDCVALGSWDREVFTSIRVKSKSEREYIGISGEGGYRFDEINRYLGLLADFNPTIADAKFLLALIATIKDRKRDIYPRILDVTGLRKLCKPIEKIAGKNPDIVAGLMPVFYPLSLEPDHKIVNSRDLVSQIYNFWDTFYRGRKSLGFDTLKYLPQSDSRARKFLESISRVGQGFYVSSKTFYEDVFRYLSIIGSH